MYEIRKFLGNKDTNMVWIMIEFITTVEQYLKYRQADGGLNRRWLYDVTLGQNGTLQTNTVLYQHETMNSTENLYKILE